MIELASTSATVGAWLSAVLLVLCMPFGWWLLWRLWHRREVRLRPNNPYSPSQQELLLRMYPAAIVCVTGMLFLVAFVGFVGQRTLGEKIVVGVFGIVFFGAGFIGISVHFLGRPRWAIAPILRERESPPQSSSEGWLDPGSQEWVDR